MFPATFARRDSDGSGGCLGSSDYESTSSKGSTPGSVPSLDHNNISIESEFETPRETALFESDPRESANTYSTTVSSFDEVDEAEDRHYEHQAKFFQRPKSEPATPQEFADLFPSTRRLIIKHDDSTLDGNMNLRVDTQAPRRRNMERRVTLFHLRMYDLRDRDFSFRRYGRDCGREVARVKRKPVKSSPQRPALQRSVTKALQSFRGKNDHVEFRKVQRQDSGYGTGLEDDEEEKELDNSPTVSKTSNTCTLEFSNYAHVELTRRGTSSSKRYDFEYWGKSYSWKRSLKTAVGLDEGVYYHLVNNSNNKVVAFIRPDAVTPTTAAEEEAKGGFVPPCSMWLKESTSDPIDSDHADVADVIVTTGLMALVDDCIKRKYHTKKSVQLVLPTPSKSPLKMNMEYVGPKRFIDEMFNWRSIASRSPCPRSASHTPSPTSSV